MSHRAPRVDRIRRASSKRSECRRLGGARAPPAARMASAFLGSALSWLARSSASVSGGDDAPLVGHQTTAVFRRQGCFWNTMVPVTTPLAFVDATDTCKKVF